MRKIRVPKMINSRRDYIKFGYCEQCRSENSSIVIHHPQRGRPYSICCRCSQQTWDAVGAANIENWLQTGRQSEWVSRNPRHKKNENKSKD